MESQKIVLITGSSSGFGRVTAETLARQGHAVFASMRNAKWKNAGASADLRTLAKQQGLALYVVDLDVTDIDSVHTAVAEVIGKTGRIDVLVNNAGVVFAGPTETLTLEQVQRQFDTNFFGVVSMNRAVLPHMRRQGHGLLIHISSTGGRLGMPFLGAYTASKFALEALAEAYRYELSGLGIDSVIIEPGGFPTPMLQKINQPADQARLSEYGSLADMPNKMFAGLRELASSPDAPNPQVVADAVAHLIATPAGERPLRTIAPGLGGQIVQPLNDLAEQLQRSLLEQMGMADLMTIASRQTAPGGRAA